MHTTKRAPSQHVSSNLRSCLLSHQVFVGFTLFSVVYNLLSLDIYPRNLLVNLHDVWGYILGVFYRETSQTFLARYSGLTTQWVLSNYGFLLGSLYEKKNWKDLVFNNALPKSLTITQIACLKAKPKLYNNMVYRQFIMIPVVLIDATNYKCITT